MASHKRFRVAFSFSSSVRKYVAETADLLTIAFTKDEILYDRYHEAEFGRADLGIYLPELYNKDVDLIVVVFSDDYQDKDWCGLEFRAIHDLIAARGDERILLCRFNAVSVTGIYRAGYVDLDKKTPKELAKIISRRHRRITHEVVAKHTKVEDNHKNAAVHNLPAIGFYLTREKYHRVILEALRPEVRSWGAILYGQGGIGKTVLAIAAAHSTRFFDEIVFISAQQYRQTPEGVSSSDEGVVSNFLKMISELLRLLNAQNLCRLSAVKRVQKTLEVMSGRRILLVADNIETFGKEDRSVLLNFLRRLPDGCKAIVTTRERFSAEATTIEVGALSQKEIDRIIEHFASGNELIARIDDGGRKRLTESTNGNPLLLCWALGQIGRENCRSVDDAIAALRHGKGENKPLSFIYGHVVDRLKPVERRIAAVLTLFDQPVRVRVVAETLQMETAVAKAALSVLGNETIIAFESEADENVIINALALMHLQQNAAGEIEKQRAHIAERVELLLAENGREKHDRFPILDRHAPVIAAAIAVFVGWENGRLQRICEDAKYFLNFSGRWDERIVLSRAAEKTAVAAGDFLSAGWRAYDGGMVHYRRGQWDETIKAAERVEEYFVDLNEGQGGVALAHRLKGLAYRGKENYDLAIKFGNSAVELWRMEVEGKDLACALNALAVTQTKIGNFAEAWKNYEEALRIAENVGAREYFADYSGNLADIPIACGRWEEAYDIVLRALPLVEKLGRRELIGRNCLRMARVQMGLENYDSAFEFSTRAKRIYERIKMPQIEEAEKILNELAINLRRDEDGRR